MNNKIFNEKLENGVVIINELKIQKCIELL